MTKIYTMRIPKELKSPVTTTFGAQVGFYEFPEGTVIKTYDVDVYSTITGMVLGYHIGRGMGW